VLEALMLEVVFLRGGCVVNVKGLFGDERGNVFVAFVFAQGFGGAFVLWWWHFGVGDEVGDGVGDEVGVGVGDEG
jgi:hypothetical protein